MVLGDEGVQSTAISTAEQLDVSRAARQRKAPAGYQHFVDDKSLALEIRSYSSTAKKGTAKKRALVDTGGGVVSDSKKSKSSSATVQKKSKPAATPIVKEPAFSVREKEQVRIEEEFVAAHKESHSKPRHTITPLPIGPSKPMDMSSAIKKGVKECSTLLLDWTTPPAKLVGAICKVFWDGENEWFYGRILNYDSGFKRHYVSVVCIETVCLFIMLSIILSIYNTVYNTVCL